MYSREIGWVLIYVFAFGISDYIIKKYIQKDIYYLFYYLLIGLIGYFIIKNSEEKEKEKEKENY